MLEEINWLSIVPAGRLVALPFVGANLRPYDLVTIDAGVGARTEAWSLVMYPIAYAGFLFRGMVVRASYKSQVDGTAIPQLELTQVLPDGGIVAMYGEQLQWFSAVSGFLPGPQNEECYSASLSRIVRSNAPIEPDVQIRATGLIRDLGTNAEPGTVVIHAMAICERVFDEQIPRRLE